MCHVALVICTLPLARTSQGSLYPVARAQVMPLLHEMPAGPIGQQAISKAVYITVMGIAVCCYTVIGGFAAARYAQLPACLVAACSRFLHQDGSFHMLTSCPWRGLPLDMQQQACRQQLCGMLADYGHVFALHGQALASLAPNAQVWDQTTNPPTEPDLGQVTSSDPLCLDALQIWAGNKWQHPGE